MYGQMSMLPFMHMPSMYSRMPLPSSEQVEEQPTYVNAKQYRRIIKRRTARALLEKRKAIPSGRKNYLHESRHAHACRRPRGPGGRFLTKDELDTFRTLSAGGMAEKEAVAQAVAEAEAKAKANGGVSISSSSSSSAASLSSSLDGGTKAGGAKKRPRPEEQCI